MPRRSILSATERESLLALPDAKDELIRHYTFNETDLSVIRQRRGAANRLGFAVQLYLRFPGIFLGVDEPPFPPLLRMVAAQLKVPVESWNEYGQREQTRREHLVELQTVFGFKPFTMSHYRQAVHTLTELALQTDKGIVLASTLVENLRRQSIILPAMNAIERASAEAITRANRRIYAAWPILCYHSIVSAWTNCSSARTAANDVAGMAAPVARQTELAPHAGTHRAPQSLAGA
jgi:TnpA family transposase